MPNPFLILATVLLLAAAPALAQPQHPERLAGSLFLGGATLVDPPPEEATGTHAYITITGAAARPTTPRAASAWSWHVAAWPPARHAER